MITVWDDSAEQVDVSFLRFPGGEPHCRVGPFSAHSSLLIDARIGSMDDLGYLLVVTDAIQRMTAEKVYLFMPYFPGARQDRAPAGSGVPLTAKVFADIINAQSYDGVYILDPHSDVTPAILDKCVTIEPWEGLKRFLDGRLSKFDALICPDAGAEKRVHAAAKVLELPVFYGRKQRDTATGRLSGFDIDRQLPVGHYLVVDDICDGGATFIGLAQAARAKSVGFQLDLYVTHGIFSKGVEDLLEHYGSIFATDSFPSKVEHHGLFRIELRKYMKEAFTP